MGGASPLQTRGTGRARISRLGRVIGAVLLIATATAYWTGVGSTAPADGFEITDGNIVDDSAAPPDWDTIFGTVSDTTGFLATSFVADSLKSDPLPSPPCSANKTGDLTVFTGGSDKNGDAISTWTFESGSIPPQKDDLSNVYAAAKKDPVTNNTIFYFGLERTGTNGSGHIDFEFLRSPIGLNATGTDANGCPQGHFTGSRSEGDLLLSVNFTNGGVVGVEDIRTWNGSAYEAVTADASKFGLFQNGAGPIACGDWVCRNSSGQIVTTLEQNAFVEGYLDVNAVLGGAPGCFSTFNAKTRSSHEFNAELKDFAMGEFNTCDANITITPSGINEVGDTHTFTGHVETNATGNFVNAPDGTKIDFAKVSGPGTLSSSSCLTTGGTGSCSVTLTSTSAGSTVVSASTTVQVGPTTVTRSTNGTAGAGGSGNATKNWVDAYIKVTPNDVNPVNEQHVFTVEYGVLPSAGITGVTVPTPTITPTVLPTGFTPVGNTCAAPTKVTGANTWTCTVTINSSVTAVYTATATGTTTVTMSGGTPSQVVLTRSTTAGSTGPGGNEGATKTYVDARISVFPDGINAVNDPHTVEGFVETKDGNGDWTPAPDGTTITFAIVSGEGEFVGDDNCDTIGSTGKCTVEIVSSEAGTTVVSASATVVVHGVTIELDTDPDNLTKEWVSASIDITPDGVNEVGDPHTFDITVTGASDGSEVTFGDVTTSVEPEPDEMSDTCSSDDRTVDGGVLTCTLTINSDTAGVFTANVDAVVTIGGVVFNLTTDGESGSGPAEKVYVDARISLTPDGVNEVGDPHLMTAVVEVNDGEGWASADGATVALTKLSGPGELSAPSCETDSSGECEATLTSDVAGVTEVGASTTIEVNGVTLVRSTNSNAGPDGSDNLEKRWVDATVLISPDGVNPVGADHTFEITVTAIPSGSGDPTFSIDPVVSPTPDELSTTCDSPTVDGNLASCTLTISNNTADVFTAHVTAEVTVGGVTVTRSTDSTVAPSGPGGTGPAEKVYVDANIQVTPDGVNAVGDPHTVTGHVNVDDGTGTANAADGVVIDFAIESGPGSLSDDSCTTAGGTGSCSVNLNSAVAGVTVVSAESTVSVGGVALDLATSGSGANSDNLTKQWIDAFITIGPPTAVNPVGEPHTFDVVVTAIPSGASPVSFDLVTTSVSPEPTSLASTCENPVIAGNTATCTLTINSSAAALYTANATATVSVDGATAIRSTDATVASAGPGGSGPATKEYVAVLGVVLARTGADLAMTVAVAIGLLTLGISLVVVTWRRGRTVVIAR